MENKEFNGNHFLIVPVLITIILEILKYSGYFDYSWFWVFSPLWIFLVNAIEVFILYFIYYCLKEMGIL